MKAVNGVTKAKIGISGYAKCVHKAVTMINRPVNREKEPLI